jgi:ABC-type transport system involved in cytochrome c biogenesis permease subunit
MLLRFYSYLFSLIFGLFIAGIALVLLVTGAKNYRFDMVPWVKGETVLYVLLGAGLVGALAAVLALLGKPLLVVFTLASFALLVYGFFVSPVYRFYSADQAKSVAWLSFAALCAFFGALMQYYPASRRR